MPATRCSRFAVYGARPTIGWMKLGWSGFRSAFAFAIIAVTSAAEANSFGGGGGVWAVSCRAIAAVISRVRIVQRTRRRIRPPVVGGDCIAFVFDRKNVDYLRVL